MTFGGYILYLRTCQTPKNKGHHTLENTFKCGQNFYITIKYNRSILKGCTTKSGINSKINL